MTGFERFVLLPVAAATLAGCIPFPYGTYYRPSYPDASAVVSQTSCGGQAGPPSRLAFQAPPGLKVSAGLNRPPPSSGGERPLVIGIDLPPDHTLRFTADTLLVSSGDQRTAKAVAPAVRAATSYRLPSETWIDAAALAPADPHARRRGDEPLLTARLGSGRLDLKGDVIEVSLPAIELEGSRVAFAPLQLEADTIRRGIRVFRTKAYLQSVIDQAAVCTRDTPDRRCENIRLYDPDSFIVTSGGFTVKGRFWMMESSSRVEPLQFDIEVATDDARRWRFADGMVQVRDAAGARHQQRYSEVSVFLPSHVALGTPIRSASTGRATGTFVRIEAGVGADESSRYVVTLPPYDFDGKRFEMKPIDFERRSLDVGLEPFNC